MPHQPGIKKSIDLIALSDAFRRHAYDQDKNYETIKELVTEALVFSTLATWYDPSETFRHKQLAESFKEAVGRITVLAKKLEADDVQLAVTGDKRSPFTAFFNKHVKSAPSAAVNVHLQRGTYAQDLSSLGKIDRRIKTAIDEGVRGLAKISSPLLGKW